MKNEGQTKNVEKNMQHCNVDTFPVTWNYYCSFFKMKSVKYFLTHKDRDRHCVPPTLQSCRKLSYNHADSAEIKSGERESNR